MSAREIPPSCDDPSCEHCWPVNEQGEPAPRMTNCAEEAQGRADHALDARRDEAAARGWE